MLTESISAGVDVLLPRATLAVWLSLMFLYVADPRKIVAVAAVFLSLLATSGGIVQFFAGESLSVLDRSLWLVSAALGCLQVVWQLQRWIKTSPAESQAQSSQLDSSASTATGAEAKRVKRLKRLKAEVAKELKPSGLSQLWMVASAAVGVAVTTAVLYRSLVDAAAFDAALRASMVAHQLAATTLCGLAIACALQTTYLSTPDALNPKQDIPRVAWRSLAFAGAVGLLVELSLCGLVFANLEIEAGQASTLAVPALFLIALLLIDFITWMVPHRIRKFQQHGGAKGWASLTLATWLAVASYGLILALPADWPWKLMIE